MSFAPTTAAGSFDYHLIARPNLRGEFATNGALFAILNEPVRAFAAGFAKVPY